MPKRLFFRAGNIPSRSRQDGNIGWLLRPHLKTAKSADVARRPRTQDNGPATVSAPREAEIFFEAGVRDILHAVGIQRARIPVE